MAHSLSAKKRVRQAEATNARNRWRKVAMREAVKTCIDKIAHGTAEEATKAFNAAARVIDRSAQKGVLHKSQAARRKSRLNARLKEKLNPTKSTVKAVSKSAAKAAAAAAATAAKK